MTESSSPPPGPPSMLPPFATAPYLNLAREKDRQHAREGHALFLAGAEALGGSQLAAGAREEIALLSDLVYYGLTAGRGRQTLGEEYCDLYAMTDDRRRRPTPARRRLLALLLAVMPYLQARARTGWGPLLALFSRDQETAQQRADRMRARMAMLSPVTNASASVTREGQLGGNGGSAPENEDENVVITTMRRWYRLARAYLVSRREWLMEVFSSLHLGWFYMHGDFADLPHRLLGVRSVFAQAPAMQQPNYYLLGVFIFAQYGVEGLRWAYRTLFPPLAASASPSLEGERRKARTVVASLETAGADATTEGGIASGSTTATSSSANFEFDEWMGTCGVCLSSLEHASTPACGHVFCYACILEASISKRECPICRQECTPQSVRCIYSFAKRVV